MFKKQYDIEEKPLQMNFLQKQLARDAVKNSSSETFLKNYRNTVAVELSGKSITNSFTGLQSPGLAKTRSSSILFGGKLKKVH